MASAFDAVSESDARYTRERLLAGDSVAEIRLGTEITARQMRAMRDEVFEPLISDPAKVKALADGPMLNPLEIVRYRNRPGAKPRMARPARTQIEMFPA